MHPSAAVAHQLKVSLLVCSESAESSILQTLLLTTGYVSYCCLSAIANQEIPGDQQSLKSSDQPVWPQQPYHSQSHFLPYSEAQFEL